MKKSAIFRTLTALMLLLTAASAATAADRFYCNATNIEPGETSHFELLLENDQPFYGFQADIDLPDGLTFVLSTDEKPEIMLSERCSEDYSIVSNLLTSGSLRMGIFSTAHTSISGKNGTLISLTVKADEKFTGGQLSISDIRFVGAGDVDTTLPDFSANIGTEHHNSLIIPDFSIKVGETTEVSMILDNETAFTAFQTDIYLPEGIIFVEGSEMMSSRGNSDHTLSVKSFEGGRTRIVCFNTSSTPFEGKSGILLTFELCATKDASEISEINVRNTICSTAEAREYKLPDSECNVVVIPDDSDIDGLETIETGESVTIENNTLIINRISADEVALFTLNGISIPCSRKSDRSVTFTLPNKGVYLLKLGQKHRKIKI